MRNKSLLFFLILVVTPMLLSAEGTLSASPAVVMLKGNAGQSTTQTLTILNSGDRPFSFEMRAQDVVVRNGKRIFVAAGELPGSIAATASFSQNVVTVQPGETLSVDVIVTIPPNPAARAIVALFHGTTKVKNRKGMYLTASLGTLLTFALSDGVAATASPLAVKAPTASSNLSVTQQLVNSGSEPLFAKGMLAIVNGAGKLVAKEALHPRRLLPGESGDVRAEYDGELPAGHYRALVTYDLQSEKTLTSSAEFDVK